MRREHQMTCANRVAPACRGAPHMGKTERAVDGRATKGHRMFTAKRPWVGVAPLWSSASSRSRALTLRVFTILTCGFLLFCTSGLGNADSLRAGSLAADARTATEKNLPILLFFTQPGCGFCERARREYLGPLAASGAWSARALIREIAIDATFAGLDGKPTAGRDLARSYGIRVFPTVIFIDASGKRIAEPLAGFTVPDFYSAYLEQRLEAASARLRKS